MTGHGEQQVVGMNPLTVVDDPDQFGAPRHHVDFDPRRQRIETVFQQLLDDTGRTLDDLARGDLVHDTGGQLVDAGHGSSG